MPFATDTHTTPRRAAMVPLPPAGASPGSMKISARAALAMSRDSMAETSVPALLSVMPMPASKKAGRSHDPLMGAIAEFVVRRRWFLLFGSAVVVLGLLAAVPRNDLNDVLVHFFDESVEFRQDTDFLDERLSGNTVLEYSLASAGPDEISDPVYLAEVSAFAEWYRAQPEVRHVTVITDTFRQLNKSMHGGDPDAYRLPESRDLASQYLLL